MPRWIGNRDNPVPLHGDQVARGAQPFDNAEADCKRKEEAFEECVLGQRQRRPLFKEVLLTEHCKPNNRGHNNRASIYKNRRLQCPKSIRRRFDPATHIGGEYDHGEENDDHPFNKHIYKQHTKKSIWSHAPSEVTPYRKAAADSVFGYAAAVKRICLELLATM